jgi:hypothetical protein
MHIPFAATLFTTLVGLAALSPVSGAAVMVREPQNGNRPVPSGACCVPNTSLKQDTCTSVSGAAGRCVPGGNNCKFATENSHSELCFMLPTKLTRENPSIGGGALSCVETANLECDANVIERGKSLCRARASGGGLFDGANIIQSLAQATVN